PDCNDRYYPVRLTGASACKQVQSAISASNLLDILIFDSDELMLVYFGHLEFVLVQSRYGTVQIVAILEEHCDLARQSNAPDSSLYLFGLRVCLCWSLLGSCRFRGQITTLCITGRNVSPIRIGWLGLAVL